MTVTISVTDDQITCFRLRHIVFVQEQGVPVEEEIDEQDAQAIHLLATRDGIPAGTARIVLSPPVAKIGRVCVLADARGLGIGASLIRDAVDLARTQPGVTRAKLGAQTHAIGFYERLGFSVTGPVYDDAGLPHRDMVVSL